MMRDTINIQQHLDINMIYDPARLAAKICKHYCQDGLILTSDGEGFDFTTNGLYDILDGICSETGFEKSKITLETWNLLESHAQYDVKIIDEIYGTRWFKKSLPLTDPTDGKILILMGRGTWARIVVHGLVQSCVFRNDIIYSFHMDLHRSPWPYGMQQVLEQGGNYESLKATTPCSDIGPIMATPIISPANILGLGPVYDQTALEIAVETVTDRGFFITEKTLRPIFYGRPFIPVAPLGFEDNLHKLGFITDFGFPSNLKRFGNIDKVGAIFDFLRTWKFDIKWFRDIKPVLEHNQKVLRELAMCDGKIDLSPFRT